MNEPNTAAIEAAWQNESVFDLVTKMDEIGEPIPDPRHRAMAMVRFGYQKGYEAAKAIESADTARDALVKARDVIMASGLECLFKDLSTCIAELSAGRITKNKYCMGCVRREALPAIEAAIAEEGKGNG